MWIYEQKTGNIFDPDDICVGSGYAGGGTDPKNLVAIAGKNNPELQSHHNVGPLPEGWYTMESPVNSHVVGPYAIPLLPDSSNEMFGRDAFYCHGDSRLEPGFASDGCIVQPYGVRIRMWQSGDRRLQVVKERLLQA